MPADKTPDPPDHVLQPGEKGYVDHELEPGDPGYVDHVVEQPDVKP